MSENVFPSTPEDMTAKEILDKYFTPLKADEYPKFIPYEKDGEHVSPFTDFMYYKKLPEVYRKFDLPIGSPLYRYLQSMLEGGYADLVSNDNSGSRGIESLLNLIDPQKCPDEFLPYFCESMGIEWFQDLITQERGTYYIRTFLSNIGEIYKRRGTESVVKYIAKVLTEMDVVLRYYRTYNPDGTTESRILWVELQANTPEEIAAVELNSKVIKRFIDTQIPYYLTSMVTFVLNRMSETGYYTATVSAKTQAQQIIAYPDISPPEYVMFITQDGAAFHTADNASFIVGAS